MDVPPLNHGTGILQAEAILRALQKWDLVETVEAVCCDTTNSNLGPKGGAAPLLEKYLQKDLLWMACRHHIMEIILGACFALKISTTTQPDVPEFKKFHKDWSSVQTKKLKSGVSFIHPLLVSEIKNKIEAIEIFLKDKMPRDDYKELLELSLLFLGSSKNIPFKKPDGFSNARWMAKAIYTLKMFLLR